MIRHGTAVSVTEFYDFIAEPDNKDTDFELIEGRIVSVVSHGYSSWVAARLLRYIDAYADDNNLGAVTGADGGYIVAGNPYIPDVAFMSFERQTAPEYHHGYNMLPPDLAVEVRSPTDADSLITAKVVNYLQVGTVVWLADPDLLTITVYVPGESPKTLSTDDMLKGKPALPGFALLVATAFPPRRDTE